MFVNLISLDAGRVAHLDSRVVQLHLNRIHAAVQLRPSMHHIGVAESKKKTAVSKNVEDVVKLEKQQEAKPSGMSRKPVTFLSFTQT